MDNKLIRLASQLIQVFKVLFVISYLALLGILVHWHVKPSAYDFVDISTGFSAGFGIPEMQFNQEAIPEGRISLGTLSHSMVYWLLFRNTVFFVMGYLIILHVQDIMKAINRMETFYVNNIERFRKIGRLWLVIFTWSCFNLYHGGENLDFSFTIPFESLLAAITSYLLAEIFAQGYALWEDQKTIV